MVESTSSGRSSPLAGLAELLLCSALAACSHAESQGVRAEVSRAEAVRTEATSDGRPTRAPAVQAGAEVEVEEPPAPDAATMADGRTLALPGREGFLTTWQVLASPRIALPSEEEAQLGTCAEEPCEAPPVVAADHVRLELNDVASRGANSVYLGATLLVPRETRVHLMVGMRGGASVWLDGEARASGDSPDRFRRDHVVTMLPLSGGEHRLVVRFDRPPRGRWRGALRVLDARYRPGLGNVAVAVGRMEEAEADALLARAVRVDEHHLLRDDGLVVRLRAHLPGGGVARPIEVTLADEPATLAPEGVHGSVHEVRLPMADRMALSARAGERTWSLGGNLVSDHRALRAAAELRELLARAPENAHAPIAWRVAELERVVREHDGDPAWRALLAREVTRIGRALDAGRDPFESIRGYERMAFFSRLDGTPQQYELFVPPQHRASSNRKWPLVVTLHGYKGNAGDYFRNTFGLARNYPAGETLVAHGRHGAAPTRGPMFVVAPTGRGQSYYRHAGEIDVLEAIEDVRRRFPAIDPDRIYITGGSMGGTGAAYLPYRHPDLFAASAALAGYHDQRVREDTDHGRLSDVERFLQAHRSDVDWAENGLHLPTLLVRGLRDRPVEWTRSLVRRLSELGYRSEHREPDLGHNVWTETYGDGAIFRWFGRYRRPSQPAHVRLRTARERTRQAWWVRVEERAAVDGFAYVDARARDGVVSAEIQGARAVTFAPGAPLLAEGAPLTVQVGEQALRGASPLTIERDGQGWRVATTSYPRPGTRRPGVEGPIREVFHEPLTFVVGTQDPDHTFVNRLVARRWARPKGWIVDYPIVDDVDVTEAMIRDTVLVLIGPPHCNSVLARMADRLPIRVRRDAVELGDETHRGAELGTVFVAPSPLAPDRVVLVIAGTDPMGTFRSIQLPDILPDYVVYDARVAPARDRWACGGTGCEYRAHGFFDLEWRVPTRTP
jgi:predicted esterase